MTEKLDKNLENLENIYLLSSFDKVRMISVVNFS
jgi:hypothetical protein